MLNRFAKTADGRKKRLAKDRRRKLASEVLRFLQLESLENRRLLASDVVIGVTDNSTSYVRTPGVGEVVYSPLLDNAEIGDFNILADLNAGLTVKVDTANAAGSEEGNITLAAIDLSLTNAVNATLEIQADNDVVVSDSRVAAPVGSINLIFNADRDGSGAGRVEVNLSSIVDTNGGNVTIGGGANPLTTPAVGTVANPDGVSIFGTVVTGNGNISIIGQGFSGGATEDSDGIFLQGTIDTLTGGIVLQGTGGDTSGISNDGVALSGGVVTSTAGIVSISGVGGGTGANENGVVLANSSLLSVTTGSLSVMGVGSAGGIGIGVSLASGLDSIQAQGPAPIAIDATGSGGSPGLQSSGSIGGATASGDITVTTDGFELLGAATEIRGTGNLLIRPLTPTASIGIGGGTGTLSISDAEISSLTDGFASITIGDAVAGSGAAAIDSTTFTDPVRIVAGTIDVDNGLTGDGGTTLTALDAAGAGQDVNVNTSFVNDISGNVIINAGDDFNVAAGASVTAQGTGTVAVNLDQSPNADAGTGSTATITGSLLGSGGTSINGGTDTDTISLASAITSLMIVATGADSGTITADAATLDYSAIEAINVSQQSGSTNITFSAASETLTVSQPVAGSTSVASSAGTSVTLVNPSFALTIDTGSGTDTVNLSSLSATFVDNLYVQDGDALDNDTVNINGTIGIVNGGFEISALNVNVNADIASDESVTLGDPLLASARVTLGGVSIATASGPVQFASPVVVAADSTVVAGSLLEFASTVDGPGSLSATGVADVIFAGAVGATTPLANLSANSTGAQVLVFANVTTSGNQVFVSPTTTNASGPITFESQSGSVSFQSSLESSPPSNITVDSHGIAQFGGNVGVNNPPQSLSVDTAGPFSLGVLVNANMDVAISVGDTPADTDDLTIATGGAIISAGGNVALNAGDDLVVQAAAAISGSAITVSVDPPAADPDAAGGSVSIDGTVTGAVTASGGEDADTFTILASGNYSILAGDPAATPGDTLVVDGNGGQVNVTPTQVVTPTATIDISGIDDISITNTTELFVDGPMSGTFTVMAVPASTLATIAVSAGPTITYDTATASALFNGSAGDDTLILDLSGGLIADSFDFRPAGNLSSNPGDQIRIIGTTPVTDLNFDYIDAHSGFINIDGVTSVVYRDLEPITSTINASNVTLNYSGVSETITVTQLGNDITVDSTSGEITTFVAPTDRLSIGTGGGADTVTVDGLNVDLATGFDVGDLDSPSDDTLTFMGTATNVATGVIDLSIATIDLQVDVTAGSRITLGPTAAGAGEIRLASQLSAGGDVDLNRDVFLLAPTTVLGGAASDVLFRASVDGGQPLTVDSGSIRFLGPVGGTTPLTSLTATGSASGILIGDDVTTVGDQTYNSPVSISPQGPSVTTTSMGGRIDFVSTIDAGTVPGGSLIIDTDDVVTFDGAIGGNATLNDLIVSLAGDLTIAHDITVAGSIDITTGDSGTDNLVIQSPAVLTTGPTGSVTLNADDDMNIQAGTTINALNLNVNVDNVSAGDDPGVGSIALVNGTLNIGGITAVTGADDADTFSVTPQPGSGFAVVGGAPTTSPGDSLRIDAAGVDVTIDVATGTITVAGTQPIAPSGIERVDLSNANLLTISGDIGPDTVSIAKDPSVVGGDLLTINGVASYALTTVTALVYNGGGGDDSLTFDASGGSPTTPVTFNGEIQDGDGNGDQITVTGSFNTQTLNYTAPGADGNDGTIDLDGTVITYTGLEPINAGDSTDTILNFNTGLSNNATLRDDGTSDNGLIEIVDDGSTFEDTVIPDPTNSLTINLGDQGDTLAVSTLDGTYAASMIINGGGGVDNVQLNSVIISNTPGRGLDVAGVETLGITDSTFSGNIADTGAGLRVVGGTATIDRSTFSGNMATGNAPNQGGGGILIEALVTIQNGSVITGNVASGAAGSGGGINVGLNGQLTIVDSTVSANVANRAGGGIEHQSNSTLTMTNVTLEDNNAGVAPATAAPGNGGGLHMSNFGSANITGGSISGNTAAAEGGGLWNSQGSMTISGGTLIEDNIAAGDLDPADLRVAFAHSDATDPTTEGWTETVNGGNTVGPILDDLGTGIDAWTTDDNSTTDPSVAQYGIALTPAQSARANSLGWSYVANIRLVDVPEPTLGTALQYTDGLGNQYSVFLGTDAAGDPIVELAGETPFTLTGLGGGYHEYNLTFDASAGAAELFVDGASVFSGYQGIASALSTGVVEWGAGVSSRQGQANFASVDFTSNVTAADLQGGGGIFNNGGTLTITDNGAPVVIQSNQASGANRGSGGGIMSTGGTVTITGASILSNEAVRAGGGIEFIDGNSIIRLADISGNDVSNDDLLGTGLAANPGNGGGLHITGTADVLIDGGTINDNVAEAEGGGLWNSAMGTLAVSSLNDAVTMTGNIARGDADPSVDPAEVQGGGAVFNNGGTFFFNGDRALRNITVSGNAATGANFGSGGAVLSIGGNISLNGATIDGNEAVRAGGGVEIVDGLVAILQTTISNNDVSAADLLGLGLGATAGNGGGVHITGAANVGFDGGTVSGNTAASEGGGLWNSATGVLRIEDGQGDTLITGNLAQGDADPSGNAADVQGGGGIFNNGGTLLFNNPGGGNTVTISSNAATGPANGSGGGILSIGGNVSISAAFVTDNEAVRAGGGIEVVQGNVTIAGTEISDNDVSAFDLLGFGLGANPGNGGGLHVTGDADVLISRGNVSNNTAGREGGGLWNSTGTMTIENVTVIDGNTADGPAADDGGGGIFNNAGTLIVTGGTISNNSADGLGGSGGGIMSLGGTVNISDALLDNNTATIDGGGLFANGAGSVTMTDARILGNVAGDSGGGAFINGPTTTVLGTTFTANEAQGNLGLDGDGGGLFVRGQTASGDFTLTASDFDSNTALGGGGGAFFVDISGAISGGSFALNQVTGNGTTFDSGGGGMAIVGETLVTAVSISGVTVDENTAPSAGGIGIVDSEVAIDNSVISNNVATDPSSGAGGIGALATVTIAGDLLSIESSSVIDNTTAGEGGGLGVINGDISVLTTTISGNRATGGRGGGVGLLNNGIAGTATFDSSTISKNTASESGGGIAVLNFGLDLQNVTISTNDAGAAGGGIAYDNNVGTVTKAISFSTITSNTSASGGSNVAATGSPIDVSSSIFNDGVVAGVLNSLGHNLDSGNTAGFAQTSDLNNTNPLLGPLQDNGGLVFTHLLLTGSPAVDGGGATGPATDARGFTRPTDGDGNGSVAFDIGSVEAGQGNVVVVDITEDVDDGDVTAGNVSLREALRLANADPDATRITFNTAVFNSPQVITLAGTALGITEDVVVEGPGSELLTIDGNDGTQLFTVSGSTTDATIQLVTLTGGNGMNLGGGAIENTDANLTVEASVISGNLGDSGGAVNNSGGNLDVSNSFLYGNESVFDGGAIASDGGTVTVTDSSISSNRANYYGGGIRNSGGDLTITGTTIANNSAAFDGGGIRSDGDSALTITNSTISGNTSDGSGGGLKIGSDGYLQYDSATITNVTITGNVGGGVAVDSSADLGVAISNSIVAGNTSSVDSTAAEFVLSSGVGLDLAKSLSNLVADPASAGGLTDRVSGNIVGDGSGGVIPVSAILDPVLSANGGPTLTHALVLGSPAIDAADPGLAPDVDQRGTLRPIDGDRDSAALEDIGSFEAATPALLTMSDVFVDEADGTATVTVLLSDAVNGGFLVDFATSDESATEGDDYTSSAGTLAFDGFAGETQTFTVPIIDDSVVEESSETILVSLANATAPGVDARDTAQITIDDNDMATLTVSDVTAEETDGNAIVSVSIDHAVEGGFTVDYTTVDGSATQPDDYTTASGTLTFGSTSSSQNISIPINNDSLPETNEQFTVVLSNVVPLGANPAPSASIDSTDIGTVTIVEAPGVSVDVGASIDDTPDPVLIGGDLIYTITVTNFSSNTATGVVSTTTLPAGLIGATAETTAGTVNVDSNIVTANIPSLAAGAVETITITSTAPADAGRITANTNVTANEADTNASNDAFSEDTTVTLPPATSSIAGSVYVDANNNGVRELGEQGIQNVLITLGGSGSATTLTNANGNYSFNALQSGNYTVSATQPSGFGDGIDTAGVGATATTGNDTFTNLDLGDGVAATGFNFGELPPNSATITGNIFCDIDDDSQNDPGEQVAGTLLFIDANDNGRFDSGEPSTTTNANGGYQFDNVTGAHVNVSVMVPPSCNTIPDEPSVRRSVIPVGDGARAITTADTDNDGDRDLLVASDFSNSLTIVENTPNGFVRGSDILLGDRPQSVFAHESGFSAARILTIAVAGIGTPADGGAVYTMDGQGSPVRHPGTAGPMDVIVADFDDDGLHDVLSASFRESLLELRLGSGDLLTMTSLSQQILSIASGDLVAPDVTQEVVVSGFGFGRPTKLEVFGLDSSGGVTIVDSIDTAPSIVEVSVERIIDNAGQSTQDEIVALYSSGKIVVYPMSAGLIGTGVETNIMPGASAFDFGDFNRDGITDVAVANLGGQFIELYSGTGDGRFALVTTVRNVSAPSDLVVDDFNGDGFDDIAVANFYSDANIDDPTLPPSFSLPSTTTVLYFEIASRSITVTSNTVATEDFVFPSADAEIILDTSRDNRITALDALRVINVLNRQSAAEGEQIGARAATDVNGDGRTSAVDALMIINYLNRETLASSINVSIDDLIPADDDDEDDDALLAAIDFVLTQNLV